MSELWLEAWRRPGHANFGRVRDYLPFRSAGARVGLNRIGDGNIELPDSFDGFDDILLTDRDTPANSRRSMIRLYTALDATRPLLSWFPSELIPSDDKDDPYTKVTGIGQNGILGYARTEAWDWDGSDDWAPKFPDWIYGGRNFLGNPSFEEATFTPRTYLLVIDASAGTFTIADGVDVTSAIPYNVGTRTLEGFIESGLGLIDDISVTPEPGQPLQYELRVTATGGTFTIGGPSDDTAALAFNISAAALETAIEGLTGVTDVSVAAQTLDGEPGYVIDLVTPATVDLSIDTTNLTGGSATLNSSRTGDGFQLQFVTPPLGVNLTVNDAGLTGTADMTLTEEGNANPNPWTKSQGVSAGVPREFGVYDAFERSDAQAHTGTYSLFINPGTVNTRIDAFAGTQQVLNVTPGGLYQAGIWVRPTAAGQTYRLVIRGVDEDIMHRADGSEARVDITPPPNVWTFVGISDVAPEDSQIIFRFANVNLSGNPAGFYVDDGTFNEGMAATTLGEILMDLYNDATVDHAAAGRVVWDDDANPGTPYLTPDFDEMVDSAGQPWAHAELSTRITMRFSYSQVMAWAVNEYEYEYRVVDDDPELGTMLWQVYNPGTMDAAPDVAIQGGASDIRRQLRRLTPEGTDWMVEGLERVTSRARNASLMSALGRIEASVLSREAIGQSGIAAAAASASARATADIESVGYVLTGALADEPLTAYTIGDTVTIVDPPEVPELDLRLVDLEISLSPKAVEWEPQFGALVVTNADAAVADAVAGLLQKFEYPEPVPEAAAFMPGGGGGMAHILIVSTSEVSEIQEKADYVVNEGTAGSELNAIFSTIDDVWSIWMAGDFTLNEDVTAPSGAWIRGLGFQSFGCV